MPEEKKIITTKENLLELIGKNKATLFPKQNPGIKLELSKLSIDENKKWSELLNSTYYSCGCYEGSISLFIVITGIILYSLFIQRLKFTVSYIVIILIILFATVIIGKVFGIILGRFRFQSAIRHLTKTAF